MRAPFGSVRELGRYRGTGMGEASAIGDPGHPLPAVPNRREAVDARAMGAHPVGQRRIA